MKKGFVSIIALVLVLALAGCVAAPIDTNKDNNINNQQQGVTQQSGEKTPDAIVKNETDEKTPDVTVKNETDEKTPDVTVKNETDEKKQLTVKEAKKIAFDHAGTKESKVTDLEAELDKDAGTLHYDISFDAGSYDYDYDIDAYTGKILHSEKEKDSDNVQTSANAQSTETKPKESTEKKKLTEKEVKKIAFEHAKVKESNVYELEVEQDKDNGKLHYDISFEADVYDYDYEIDAYTGKILRNEKEKDNDNVHAAVNQQTTEKTKLTKAEVKKIAFGHANVKAADVYDLEVELDDDDGKTRYEITFQSGGYEYDYEVDAYTGKILRSEKERDD